MKKLNLIFTSVIVSLISLQTFAASPVRQISVEGNCLKSVKPNRGSIDFYAEVLNPEAQKATEEATKIFQAARAKIKEMNLKGLELATITNSVHEEKVWQKDREVSKGFKAMIGLKVSTTEIEKIGEVIATLSKAGIKNIGSLTTDISPARLKAEQEACLETAIGNAKSKALRMAKAAGARVGKVISIDENGGNSVQPPSPYPMARGMMYESKMASDSSAGASIDTKAHDLTMSVRVVFSLD